MGALSAKQSRLLPLLMYHVCPRADCLRVLIRFVFSKKYINIQYIACHTRRGRCGRLVSVYGQNNWIYIGYYTGCRSVRLYIFTSDVFCRVCRKENIQLYYCIYYTTKLIKEKICTWYLACRVIINHHQQLLSEIRLSTLSITKYITWRWATKVLNEQTMSNFITQRARYRVKI